MRYCWKQDQPKPKRCAVADADDSMMAMWIELLYRMAPNTGLPAAWAESIQKAEYQLDSIYQADKKIFFISKAMPVGLLMDNIEIYAAFMQIAKDTARLGLHEKTALYEYKANS